MVPKCNGIGTDLISYLCFIVFRRMMLLSFKVAVVLATVYQIVYLPRFAPGVIDV
jgi:hypothetical protein